MNEDEFQEFKKEQRQHELNFSENDIVKSGVAGEEINTNSIVEIEFIDNKTPEIIIPNGAMGIFSQGKEKGWECKKGDTIEWSFEKYPLEEFVIMSFSPNVFVLSCSCKRTGSS